MKSKKIIDKLTCMPVSKTSYPKYARHLPAHFCKPYTGQHIVTTQRTREANITSCYPAVDNDTTYVHWLIAWHSGRTSVFGRRTFRSTCSWRVTIYVDKPSAIGQPTRPTQPFIPSGSMNEQQAAIGCLIPQLWVAPSGERLQRKGWHGVICR